MSQTNQQWGGRFTESTDAFVQAFTASVQFDRRLALHDIRGSLAHAAMLARAGLLTGDEAGRFVERAQPMIAELPGLAECADGDALRAAERIDDGLAAYSERRASHEFIITLKRQAKELGFAVDNLIWVEHTRSDS